MNAPPASTPQTVLVADDDPDLVALIEHRLVKAGYRVITARDGLEALDQTMQHVPHLAVLDMMMPKLTGVEVMERLRADPATQNVRVVLISASFEDDGPTGGVPAGADDYVKKPFGPKELPTRVRAVLERATTVSDLADATAPPG